ncbi:30S ribosomal protein S18 [Candidatus Falkowbacteria bacterium RIFOXYD2_FULL_35_9]|uniref:Small ribosomal subunit protein bS18 n=1 Tax=Candidatus Falkowbacteria bacterium RIFOXYC2_FULL_36_12 TaxID=1798002 RepID=A0A1F5T314_9BACT|nr:MAG: 30S ribosomal protein S18 [Candidatus Falkowbacteria bacterium RIFOXYB2_FULL_35_7]OGF33066.1 MAG: 30S ribosomal protein S18 [Candidatus Falkowbacteria bacterium RIFOXYA2_FULL_35_8]OGF33374.1 MAG: 30S ribosomal protein S18 [Candidatus Falkowbacteria bacterium RIFOXYC2_FULL_36_12]OGF46056.1 MAG: 30S ribosomal protein S18 [Candidatus Falkowbacteria bacterium RIFOXYD2_FULL_35_9]
MYNKKQPIVEKACYYCVNGLNEVDYKQATLLQKFVSSYGKIAQRRRSGLCSKHQRKSANAIKRARFMALLPYIAK